MKIKLYLFNSHQTIINFIMIISILGKYNKYNAEERRAWDVHTCCFAVVCVISYSTVVQYVTWIILFLKLCDAEYTHKPLFECVSGHVNKSKYIHKTTRICYDHAVWLHPIIFPFYKITWKKVGNSTQIKRDFRYRENGTSRYWKLSVRFHYLFKGRGRNRFTNSRRRRKLIKLNGILGEVDARPFPRNDQLINFL